MITGLYSLLQEQQPQPFPPACNLLDYSPWDTTYGFSTMAAVEDRLGLASKLRCRRVPHLQVAGRRFDRLAPWRPKKPATCVGHPATLSSSNIYDHALDYYKDLQIQQRAS